MKCKFVEIFFQVMVDILMQCTGSFFGRAIFVPQCFTSFHFRLLCLEALLVLHHPEHRAIEKTLELVESMFHMSRAGACGEGANSSCILGHVRTLIEKPALRRAIQ